MIIDWHTHVHTPEQAAAALALLSAAAVTEALFSQGLFWSQRDVWPPLAVWAFARLPLLVATAFVSLLVLRRLQR